MVYNNLITTKLNEGVLPNWFMIACQRAFIRNTNCKPLVQFNETENKQDLLAREVVGAQISFYWAYGRLEVPDKMWVRIITNSIHSVWYNSTSAYFPDLPSNFLRVWFWFWDYWWPGEDRSKRGWTSMVPNWTLVQAQILVFANMKWPVQHILFGAFHIDRSWATPLHFPAHQSQLHFLQK